MEVHNCSPPNASSLTAEASGEGLLSIFIRQTLAEYKAMGLSPGEERFLRGFEANILRVASDFFGRIIYLSGFLTETGLLIEAEEWRLQTDLRYAYS